MTSELVLSQKKISQDSTLECLTKYAKVANREARRICGHRGTCILTSAALVYALNELGYEASPIRVRCAIHSDDRHRHGVILGSDGDGMRQPAAATDKWHGHLAVVVNGEYLIDATVDQAGYGKPKSSNWIRLTPLVTKVNGRFVKGMEGLSLQHGNANLFYNVRARQVGFRSAPDWKFKSHWMPVAQKVLNSVGG